MGYLAGELLIFLLIAFLLGLLIGYWIWGSFKARYEAAEREAAEARAALENVPAPVPHDDSALRGELSSARGRIADLEALLAQKETELADAAAQPAPAPAPMAMMPAIAQPDAEAKAKLAASPFLDKPIGVPDDLMLVKGIGPKLSQLLHSLGVYHFFQIAGWSEADIAKVDGELANFKGRIARDEWIDQAKLLAAGDVETFKQRYGEMGENRK